MAHDVRFSVPERPLAHADVEFNVYDDNGKFGTLRVSKGAVVWFPYDGKVGRKLGWGQLHRLFEQNGKMQERRKRAKRE
ncbi:MAG: hypothetical protein KA371_12155 [Acidobacteria bacterium]|nr:hypothetical protein [Acidobacteriota bacterium]